LDAKIIILSVLGILFLAGNFGIFAFGQIPSDVNLTDPNAISPVDEVVQYCILVNEYGMNDGKEDIKGDLVETGKVGTMYRDMTCEDVKELDERMERMTNTLNDLKALNDMEK